MNLRLELVVIHSLCSRRGAQRQPRDSALSIRTAKAEPGVPIDVNAPEEG